MSRFVILGIAISLLFFPLFSQCDATMVKVEESGVKQKGVSSKAPDKAAPAQSSAKAAPAAASSPSALSVRWEVVNILVDRIENGAIYSKDGRKFEITNATRFINNSHRVTKMRAAELSFENGRLVAVSLK